ncbi:MAG TPA: hypothetical protein VKA30_08545 [Actinomycetota bacterium]|nr:hypothetical protein [Actinomycetota bacterium]
MAESKGRSSGKAAGATGDGQTPAPAAPICSVAFCPICTMVTAMGEARPDLVEHLLLAGREMLLAARAVIDARLETMDGDKGASKLERITIE